MAQPMKKPFPQDVWETKRAQITQLYMHDEWPLKHVIKVISTGRFQPRCVLPPYGLPAQESPSATSANTLGK
ncbi:hypothetical protein BJX65DRAFT_268520 [Aspergillus insuetus]